jgi:Flp pilus assembly protein TadG
VAQGGRARSRGQTLVEFALVMPAFFMLLFGLIDGSRMVFLNSTLSQAAREGAREASVEASWIGSTDSTCGTTGGPTCPANNDMFRNHVVAAVNRMTTAFGTIPSSQVAISCDATTPPSGSWTGQSCSANTSGNVVSVRVTYTFTALTPLFAQILGNVTMSGSASMSIN